jgi:hypothetical protein
MPVSTNNQGGGRFTPSIDNARGPAPSHGRSIIRAVACPISGGATAAAWFY